MTGRTHDLIAFASLMSVAIYFPPKNLNITTTFAALIGNVVGALVPDMDQATNRLWEMLPGGGVAGRVLRYLFIQHRSISHSLLGGYLFFKILNFAIPKLFNSGYINTQILILSIMIGFVSHIIADMITKEGVPLFFPIPLKIGIPPFKLLRITTGKIIEKLVIFPGVVIYIFWLISSNKSAILRLFRMISY